MVFSCSVLDDFLCPSNSPYTAGIADRRPRPPFGRPPANIGRVALVYTELAGSFREMDRLEEAQEAVRRALEIWPGHWEAYLAAWPEVLTQLHGVV